MRRHIDVSHYFAEADDVFGRDYPLDGRHLFSCHAPQDLQFLGMRRVVYPNLQHKSIHLRFGEGVGAFLFDWVLRRQNEERLLKWISCAADGDLSFLHCFEERALHFGGCAVNLIGEDDVCENRSLFGVEVAARLFIDECA